MGEFAAAFMGHVGFEELKKHCRQGDEFCKEVLAVFSERATAEQVYGKSLKRLSQRLSKACSNMFCSPLYTLWRSICAEMDKESESHRKFGISLQEDCVKPTGSLLDNQSKLRKSLELKVESTSKVMSDRVIDHTKAKKKLHQLSKEREALTDQKEGARPKTEKDEMRLALKQKKNEELLWRSDDEYYDSLIELQNKQLDWEFTSLRCCAKVQELEQAKLDLSCRNAMSYSTLHSDMTQAINLSSDVMKKHCNNLNPEGEIRIVVENKKGTKYQSERLLCDYYEENFNNRIKSERRVASLSKILEKFLGDLQKERAHYDGMVRLKNASSDRSTEEEMAEMDHRLINISSMITFLEVNQSKLQQAIATVTGTSGDHHPLTQTIEQHCNKQGIIHSTYKVDIVNSVDEADRSVSQQLSISPSQGYVQAKAKQRSQSVNCGKSNSYASEFGPKRHSTKKGGTLSAKEMQFLSEGMGKMSRKQAPAPPVKNMQENRSPGICRCVAKYLYESRQPDELTIREGDVINVIEKCDADWWKGEINGSIGIFPASYVDVSN